MSGLKSVGAELIGVAALKMNLAFLAGKLFPQTILDTVKIPTRLEGQTRRVEEAMLSAADGTVCV